MFIHGLGRVFWSLSVLTVFLHGVLNVNAEEDKDSGISPLLSEAAIADIDRRLGRIEKTRDDQFLLDTLESLRAEVDRLRNEIKEQTHIINQLKQKQRDLYTDTDRRLQRLEEGTLSQAGAQTNTITPTEPENTQELVPEQELAEDKRDTPKLAKPPANPLKAEARYQDAFRLLRKSQYETALRAFREFLKDYPDNQLSDNAQYWVGEANYILGKYDLAIIEYQSLLFTYPDSQKAPDALLKIAYSYIELGNVTEARKVLKKIIAQYPDTTTAHLAETNLHETRDAE